MINNTWIDLTVCKEMTFYSFKNKVTNKLFAYIYIYIYIYINRIWLYIMHEGWYAIKPNKLTKTINTVLTVVNNFLKF